MKREIEHKVRRASNALISALGSCLIASANLTDLFQLEHVLFPALRRHLVPPKSLLKNKNVTQIADLPDLYKTFERC